MSYEFIKVDRDGPVTTITINRPEVMNAIHPPAALEMDEVFQSFQDDPEQWVAILTGAGEKAFSAGNDLKFQAEHGGAVIRKLREQIKGGFGGIARRTTLYKPVIAAVNGFALGGGFEMALACDIIIAAEHATFGLPEPRVGLMAGAGGVHRLPRQMPYHAAMGVLLAGKRLTSDEAFRYGIANEVVSQGDLMKTARRWCDEILKGAPISIQATKEATVLGLDMPLPQALDAQFPQNTRMYASEDFIEGPKAFAEKRPPNWKGA